MSLRVVFMGTPDFAVPVLAALLEGPHDVVATYTKEPAAAGRGLKSRPSPVHRVAEAAGVPVETPPNFRDPDAVARLAAYRPDVAVVVAYGLLLPPAVLAAPRLGALNLHASLLPRWRGAAPIHRAVLAGDRETGLAVMRMEAGLDTGPVALTERLPIGPDDTTGDLHDTLAALGGPLIGQALAALEEGRLAFVPQPADGVTYAAKIRNEEAAIDWDRPAAAVHDQIRGLSPWPGAFFTAAGRTGPERVRVLRAEMRAGSGPPGTLLDDAGTVACGTGAIGLLRMGRPGRAPAQADAVLRGMRLQPGTRLAPGTGLEPGTGPG